ncbi:uncharacterized protein LOC107858243 [Capsicum annuum]|uniref:uncharacterized protein LOC107858243 n=1 Tax=Capsicum annuum TaxID=4072 RepID=UPI001FB1227F|nr:uncharacterized protein LOC107858243 [Capsicum annuum]
MGSSNSSQPSTQPAASWNPLPPPQSSSICGDTSAMARDTYTQSQTARPSSTFHTYATTQSSQLLCQDHLKERCQVLLVEVKVLLVEVNVVLVGVNVVLIEEVVLVVINMVLTGEMVLVGINVVLIGEVVLVGINVVLIGKVVLVGINVVLREKVVLIEFKEELEEDWQEK